MYAQYHQLVPIPWTSIIRPQISQKKHLATPRRPGLAPAFSIGLVLPVYTQASSRCSVCLGNSAILGLYSHANCRAIVTASLTIGLYVKIYTADDRHCFRQSAVVSTTNDIPPKEIAAIFVQTILMD